MPGATRAAAAARRFPYGIHAAAQRAGRSHPSGRDRAVEAGERRPHRLGAVGRRHPRGAVRRRAARRSPDDPDRDRFVLSKGHAALALYAALHQTGRLTPSELDTYCADGSRLGVHPEHALPGIDFSTGSLGHGLSIARRRRARRAAAGLRAARVRAAQRRRVQRGLGVGGGDVRRAPPAREPRRDRRRQRPAGARLHRATCSTSRRSPTAGARSAGTCTRSTATTSTRSRDDRAASDTRAGRAARPHRAHDLRQGRVVHGAPRSTGTTGRCPTSSTRRRSTELEAAAHEGRSSSQDARASSPSADERIVLLTGDLGFTVLEPFAERFPDRFFNVGVAEQNMVGRRDRARRGRASSRSSTRSPRSRRCGPTSSSATARSCTSCRCGSSASAAASTTATTASRTTRSRTSRSCACSRA